MTHSVKGLDLVTIQPGIQKTVKKINESEQQPEFELHSLIKLSQLLPPFSMSQKINCATLSALCVEKQTNKQTFAILIRSCFLLCAGGNLCASIRGDILV